ncbi:acyloxyacyl hydrolase [Marinobacter changyiensis]|uniref:acyloxyacyl hydrolase n=1 Tax=Marinobacter changyiensis TaxID=2604091 RepID=UPI00126526D0|nr:acyloxyacyl hydrolase [Marinobacter changyiensis]
MAGKTLFTVATLFVAGLSLSSPSVYGESESEQTGRSLERPLVNFTAGQVGVDRNLNNLWRYGLEYRFSPLARYRLVPSIGVVVGADGANYIYAELRRDFRFAGHWLLTPSFGLGRFNNRSGFNLGHMLEFRSGLEISHQFNQGYRLGVAVFHLSNGGLSDENPGTEAVVLSFSVPLGDNTASPAIKNRN